MLLAITLRTLVLPDRKPWDQLAFLSHHYHQILAPMGVSLFPVYPGTDPMLVCKLCDGLIVDGTMKNIPPEHYGCPRLPEMAHTYTVDEYAIDSLLVAAFSEAGKPILGVCGGIQTLNVFFGGTLHQLIPGHNDIPAGHRIQIVPGSFLSSVYGPSASVNSYHRQCVDQVAPGFAVTARAEDGTVEAIEKGNILGVQWHPEVLLDAALFKAFLNTYF